ncbi:Bug family tripartite tricarboxylate transporter substrate binding protein [Sabulicella rubraurantiaca]|uniref:Bug family tripartite tricarboxylate transporter substrate binding protein n=1 Tax=Sabulicella rubraurantiaca TaxID=2811429 RepID=UPI001A9664FD|nr:tripartite tricarboxylate transporter substrate binding protein [Sabulicella rubraurantiaca]
MTSITRRSLAALLPLPAFAQNAGFMPDRPVTVVAPFSAGGAADLAARLFAQHAPKHMGAGAPPMVVENRTGASGAVGTQYVARARPDGTTLLLARVGSSAVLPATDSRTPYTPDDFTWLGLLDENPYVVCVRADAPWNDLRALLAAMRESPGRLNFATSGPATILDLGVRQMMALAELPMDAAQALPFRGGGDALVALLGGQAQFVGNNLGDMMGAIRDGRVRALVVSTASRLPDLPDVPTAQEAGMPRLAELAGWNAVAAPANLPEAATRYWSGVIAALAQDEAWVSATRRLGSVPRILGPEETRAHVVAQIAMFRGLAQRLGLG